MGPQGDGPGATLRYRGGGTGHPDHPKPASWNDALGRYWSHDYAETIVEDPDATHVWLLTSSATFREFTDAGGDGDYETEWEHPSQVLDRPHPGFRILLVLCKERLEDPEATGRDRLAEVRDKLERSVRISDEARERRERKTASRSKKDG